LYKITYLLTYLLTYLQQQLLLQLKLQLLFNRPIFPDITPVIDWVLIEDQAYGDSWCEISQAGCPSPNQERQSTGWICV